jgi:hypothetical protein
VREPVNEVARGCRADVGSIDHVLVVNGRIFDAGADL